MSESASVFWAAFGGSVAAGLITLVAVLSAEWFRWFLDRPLLNLYLHAGNLIVKQTKSVSHPIDYIYSHTVGRTPDYIFVDFKNPHTKPVVIASFGLNYGRSAHSKQKLVMTALEGFVFPYKLEGGAHIMQWYEIKKIFSVLNESSNSPSDLKYVWAEAASGKVFRGKIDTKVIMELEQAYSNYKKSEDKN